MTEKEKLLETFKAFVKFCDSHNIKYFAAYGTAIGAVRHHGFIPWDDDIDVHMMQEDYERFLSLKDQIPSGYRVSDISEFGYTATFAKFMDTNSSIWEYKQVPYMLGSYIDIFPLHDCHNTEDMYKKKIDFNNSFFKYSNSLNEWEYRDLLSFLLKGHPRAFLYSLKTKFYDSKNRKIYYWKMLELYKVITSIKDDDYCISTCSFFPKTSIMRKEWFNDTIDMKFEDMIIKVPIGYDAYLTHLYHDYMTLPPVEKRVSYHGRYFECFNKGYTIDQAQEIISLKSR